MARYTFQTGGEQQSQFNYTNNDFFNNVVDQSQQQAYGQEYSDQSQTPTPEPQQPEESDYIKNLRSYDAENSQNEAFNGRLDQLENAFNQRFDQLQNQQQQQDFYGSQDGVDYFNDLYDSRTSSTPLEQAQLQAESGGNDNAISPKGAMGAYQFMPQTWNEYKPSANASPFNRQDAQSAYGKYMHVLLTQFGNDQRKAAAAYNAGQGRVAGLIKQYGDGWEDHLPQETKGYLKKVFSPASTKAGANIQGVNQSLLGLVNSPGLVITSGTDGRHTGNSAHYDGEAVDIGANSSNKEAYSNFKQSLPELKRKYGVNYLDEGDHIHISLSSKGKT